MIRKAWDVPIGNRYGMSEGVFAGFCGRGIHLPDDLARLTAAAPPRGGAFGTILHSP